MPTPKSKSKVVIVGAGPAGVHLAQLLHRVTDVTMVDRCVCLQLSLMRQLCLRQASLVGFVDVYSNVKVHLLLHFQLPNFVLPVCPRQESACICGLPAPRTLEITAGTNRKTYFEINWATVRAHVQPRLADAIFVPYQDIPGLGDFVQAEVAAITSSHVELDTATTLQLDQSLRLPAKGSSGSISDPSKLPYDCLAICTGSSYSNSTNKAGSATQIKDRRDGVQAGNQALQNAGSVLVIGAGPAGVETAAEIAKAMAGKLVTLVSSDSTVLPGTPPAMSKHVLHWLKKHGVKVLLNERVVKAADGTHTTEKGTRLDADVVYTCMGAKPCTGFMKKHFAACLDEQSRIKVDSNLRIVGESPMNIFALGDCNNIAETKLGFLARAQAEVAAANIKTLMRQPSGVTIAPKLDVYKPNNGGPKVLVVALGRKHGVMHVGGVVVEHLLPRIKSKGLFIAMTRKQLGLKDRAKGQCMRAPATQA